MPNRERKPPIIIDKLGEDKLPEEHKPGSLGYVGKVVTKSGATGGLNWTQILISCIISIVIAAVIVFQIAPSKGAIGTLQADMVTLSDQIALQQQTISNEAARTDNIINTMGEYAKTTALASYASQTSVDSLLDLPAEIDAKFAALTDDLDLNYEERIADLESQIAELMAVQEEEEEEAVEKDGVVVNMGFGGQFTFEEEVGGLLNKEVDAFLYFGVENTLAVDVEKIEIRITIFSKWGSVDFDKGECTVDGWPLDWNIVHTDGVVIIKGTTPTWGDPLEIDAGEDESFSIQLHLESASSPDEDVVLFVQVEVDNYSIVE